MKIKKVLVIGDVHTRFGLMNQLISKKQNKIDAVLQLGDFGYWPDEFYLKSRSYTGSDVWEKYWDPSFIKSPVPIYWVDGNHENHPALIADTAETNEVAPNCFYQKRGSVLTLGLTKILFIGGAFSIDKASRTPGKDWFPEETISQKDVYNLPDEKIDMVISHTGPNEFVKGLDSIKEQPHYKDPSTDALSVVLEKYKPRRWYFGHWHTYQKGFTNDCNWETLDYLGDYRQKSWTIIDV